MTKFMRGLLAGLFAVVVGGAQAGFVDHDSYSTDTTTGLDWLDVTATAGLTYAGVKAGAGGWTSSGWRYATGGEVRGLFSLYVGTGPDFLYTGEAFTKASNLIRQLGVSISFNNTEGVQQVFGPTEPTQILVDGYFDDGTADSRVGLAELMAHFTPAAPGGNPDNSSRWVAYDDFWFSESTSAGAGFGSFLVRQSLTVPEPGTLALLALGLAGLGYSRRKQQISRR